MPSKIELFQSCAFPYSLFPCAFPCAIPEPITPDPTKFDYIVIGAGTAGG